MSRSSYWKLEAGTNFELMMLIKICRVLDVSLEEFFKRIDLPAMKKIARRIRLPTPPGLLVDQNILYFFITRCRRAGSPMSRSISVLIMSCISCLTCR